MRSFVYFIVLLFFAQVGFSQSDKEEKYLKVEEVLKSSLEKKQYKLLFKKAQKAINAFPKKAFPFYCLTEATFNLKDDLKFRKKVKKPLEVIRKALTEAKKYDKNGILGNEFLPTIKNYQILIYKEGQALQKNGFTKGDQHFNNLFKLFDNSSKTYQSMYNGYDDLPDSAITFKEFNHPRYRICNTAKSVDFLNQQEKQMIYIINLIRMDPQVFRKTFIQYYVDKKGYSETEAYFSSLISDLTKATPCVGLIFAHNKLTAAADFHAKDMGNKGMTGHTSSDGTDTFTRIERYVKGGGMAENCQYGPDEPIEVIMQLMIDSGISSLGHRKTLMNCDYTFIGIAQRNHKSYGTNTVMDFME